MSPSSSSSSSSSKLPLILCDKEVAKSLREWQVRPAMPTITTPIPIPKDLDGRLQKLVDGISMMLNTTTDDGGDSVAHVHVRAMTDGLLQRLIHHDPNNSPNYQQLIHNIKPPSPPLPPPQLQLLDSGGDLSTADVESIYQRLSFDEKKCLKAFASLPEGFVVNKQEFFYFFFDLHIRLTREERDNIVAKLAAERLITRLSSNCFSNNYTFYLHASVLSWFHQKENPNWFYSHTEHGCGFHFNHYYDIVININNKILNNNTAFNLILEKIKSYDDVVLHLGSWRRQSANHHSNNHHYRDDYFVVDIDSLHKFFKQTFYSRLRFLILRGTSGIIHFPDSVSNLNDLQILDLSACNNLESLPKGIVSLQVLEYLDMSECHLLKHIPIEIASLSNFRVLKGFVINNSDPNVIKRSNRGKWCKKAAAPTSSSSSYPFTELIHLENLQKLTIRTQRMGFPKNKDLHTLYHLPLLHTLGITWVGNHNTAQIDDANLQEFPITVEKLELQSAPHQIASLLFELIGKQKQDSCLNKLYIRGGWFREFIPEKHCLPNVKIVRLRYLSNLEGKWNQFKLSFPDLTCLEVFQCPNLSNFPCENNGIWQQK